MKKEYIKTYSHALNRDMEINVYGHAGKPILYIPCQDGRFFDFENFNMTDVWQPWIDAGKAIVFSIDTIDLETWSNKHGDARWRIERYEAWIRYITDEVVPLIRCFTSEGISTFGCSLGATHAANLYFRRPDIFSGMLALSGIYTADYGFDGYMDDLVYANSPIHYMANFPTDHPYMGLYNRDDHHAIICCGQGAWEQPDTTWRIKEICERKGINVWVDLWGYDVCHDWDWWYKQTSYFIPYLLNE